ncbi:BTAD domain-containing putative transcriptional regulator [Micromonospora sp. NPDC047074]|uniref:AfsR/SARP family transcriptional regulator n=1 Tax=Micromonospora sp. NPDC047074 TaxID=3154339 RepID=UPI0033D05BD5
MSNGGLVISLLGPLVFQCDGELHSIASSKRRTLLAVLATRANMFVPLQQLVEDVWDGVPPPSAENLIRQYVLRLRRLLESGTGPAHTVIETRPSGYQLSAPRTEVDSHLFRDLVRDGTAVLRRGRHEEAIALLTRALGLWRGSALVDVTPSALVTAEAMRLEECRGAATELLMEARLARGDHQSVVDELTYLVAAHPQRERLRGFLMSALAATGRRADALAVYRDGRRLLVDEIGIEPGPELRALHQRILADGGTEAAPSLAAAVEPAPPSRPCDLPADVVDLVGRNALENRIEAESLRILDGARRGGAPRVLVISGATGVGKTALAVRVAHRIAEHFPDGQLCVSPADAETELPRVLRALGVPARRIPGSMQEQHECYRATLRDRRMLILLDDASDESQVRFWLPLGRHSLVLVTSRSVLAMLGGAVRVTCPPLRQADSVELLRRTVGGERVDADVSGFRDLALWCTGVPMVLEAAGALLLRRRDWSAHHLVRRLSNGRPLDELHLEGHAVRCRLERSYERLRAMERRLLSWLVRAGDPTPPLPRFAAECQVDPADAERAMERLLDLHLVDVQVRAPGEPVRYVLNQVTRALAWEKSGAEGRPAH